MPGEPSTVSLVGRCATSGSHWQNWTWIRVLRSDCVLRLRGSQCWSAARSLLAEGRPGTGCRSWLAKGQARQ